MPTLRFPGFTDKWEKKRVGDIAKLSKGAGISKDDRSISGVPCILYGELYTTYNSEIINKVVSKTELPLDNLVQSEGNDVIIPSSGESAIDISTARCITTSGILLGGDLNIIRLKNDDGRFLSYQLNGVRKLDIAKVAQGVSVVHLYGDALKSISVSLPHIDEQKKIADFLSLLDERIALQSKLIEDLKKLKSAIRANIFQRLKNAPTHTKSGAELLLYEQPTKYIVEDYEYSSDKTQTPVLTANKSLILGYTSENFGVYDKGNCIILDDFTLDMKFITFPFKVKSSAIKILTAKCGVNLRFIFEQLQWMGLTPLGHNRHYISMVEPMQFYCPSIEVQRNIAQLLDKADDKLRNELQLLELLIKQKSFLLSAMFI